MAGRFVIIGFERKTAALIWYNSPEYQTAADIRRPASLAYIFIINEVLAGTSNPTREWGNSR